MNHTTCSHLCFHHCHHTNPQQSTTRLKPPFIESLTTVQQSHRPRNRFRYAPNSGGLCSSHVRAESASNAAKSFSVPLASGSPVASWSVCSNCPTVVRLASHWEGRVPGLVQRFGRPVRHPIRTLSGRLTTATNQTLKAGNLTRFW